MNQAIPKNALIKLNREGNKFPKGAIKNFLLTSFLVLLTRFYFIYVFYGVLFKVSATTEIVYSNFFVDSAVS